MNQTTDRKIEIRERVTRADVRADQDKIFIFGDNLAERGFGGQAKEMRGEANAVGVPTKKAPDNNPQSFFTDRELAENKRAIDQAFGRIPADKTIVLPQAGIGTGLARLEEKAPQTFAYLNEKFAAIGFDNRRGEKLPSRSNDANGVVVQSENDKTESGGAKRLLDLDDIKTAELKLLSPTAKEIAALDANRERALADYADRLRLDYKENKENLRDGFRNLSDAIDKGEQIKVVCACRNNQICHADVVKMAIEKVNAHIKRDRESKTISAAAAESRHSDISQTRSAKVGLNPRTQRTINEILAAGESDRILANLTQTDGRNRSEQASYLGKFSQFARDIYERGAKVSEGKLLVPQENLSSPAPLAVTTQEYAVKRLGEILRGDETKAKGLAPTIVEYGEKISGLTADNETRLKVFGWIYDTLEGKSESAEQTESKETRFENALSEIKIFADEMHSLEPTDKIEFAPLAGDETAEQQQQQRESAFEYADESRIAEEIYENAIYRTEGDAIEEIESFDREGGGDERGSEFEVIAKIGAEKYERIDLNENFPPLPEDFTAREGERFLTATLPEIDRRLESGIEIKEVLKPFNQNIWQSQKDDAHNRLETIFQKQQIAALENKLGATESSSEEKEKLENELSLWQLATLTPTREELREMLADRNENGRAENKSEKRAKTVSRLAGKSDELSERAARQIAEINIFGATVIEIETPAEFRLAEETAVRTFFRKTKQEIARRLEKLDGINRDEKLAANKSQEAALKKELNQIREMKPIFAFKLETAAEAVVGNPSPKAIEERNFVAFYISHQLKQPETRLRFENERYRAYAARLESATTREEVIKTASEIRAENAARGMNRQSFEKVEKTNQPRSLTNREMQFLFTETSPAHYTQAMTVARLSYAHAGASRRMMTESLLKGEISPSPEARKLIESLESRLRRGKPADAISATKHFFESVKTSNEDLKYKNAFDHREIYRLLPPPEKDFVYERAVRQKENLEYQVAYRLEQQLNKDKSNDHPRSALSQAEKSFHLTSLFHQAQILGERFESAGSKSKEIDERDLRAAIILLGNHSGERVALIGDALRQSANIETQKVGEILEIFSKAEISEAGDKREIRITLPENRLVSTDAYRELLEKFYPNETRENDKYKFANFNEKTIEDARTKGQDAALATFGEELKQNVYAADTAPPEVFSVEQSIGEDLAKIAALQSEARDVWRENGSLLAKYAARAEAKMRSQNSVVVLPATEQRSIVRAALSTEKSDGAKLMPINSHDEFFRFVQKEITVSDFQKFAANEKLIGKNLSGIKNQFAAISTKQKVLKENKFRATETRATNKLQDIYTNARLSEENRLLTEAARTAFERGDDGIQKSENKLITELIGDVEKSEIRAESFAPARVALEPELKDGAAEAYHQQALKLADAIETAHGLSKQNAAPEKIAAAFTAADNEKKALDAFSESRIEKTEARPFSLQLYEAEIERAEKELRKQNFGAKILAGVQFSESELSVNLDQIFSPDERERIKTEAAEIAKSRLEPKELDADQQKIPKEASRQAMATFRQLEQAHNVFQLSGDSAKVNEAFSKLDREALALKQIRQDYSRAERLAVLRETVKTDVADLLRKNSDLKGGALVERTGEILAANLPRETTLNNAGKERVNELSRVIVEKIEASQSKTIETSGMSRQQFQSRGGQSKSEIAAQKNERDERQSFVFVR